MAVWSVTWKPERSRFKARDFVLAVSSVFVCTIHYFGIFTLFFIAAGSAVWISRTTRNYRRLIPVIAGPIALAACTPFYLGQTKALSVPTWISPLSPHQIRELLEAYVFTPTILATIGVFVLSLAWRVRRSDRQRLSYEALLPLLALLCMPLLLVVISAFVQPSMQLRYVLPAILAWTPLVALVADRLSSFGKTAFLCLLFFFSVNQLSAYADQLAGFHSHISSEKTTISAFLDSGFVLMDPSRASLYPLAEATARPSQLVIPDFTDSVARARKFSDRMIIDRDVSRVHNRLYGFPLLESIDEIHSKDLYVFLPVFETAYTLSLLFPDAQVTSLGSRVYRIRARGDSIARAPDAAERGIYLYNTRHPEAALSLLDSVLASDPNHYAALWYRAASLEELGLKGDAMRAWRLVISQADQNGWRNGLQQAKIRQARLLCGDLSPADLTRAALPRLQSFRRRFMC
jgi:tetratricopeptide (TPR) repeat protein